ncbi:MAG: ABC transporter permease subunit [Eubacteriales bacterium]|nr:ABC transporter permease subunit [Eubacteriales bacterium]
MTSAQPHAIGKAHPILRDIRKRWMLHLFIWCGLAFLFVFNIIPITGLQMAFRTFKLKDGFAGIFNGQFVGFQYFNEFLSDRKFTVLLRNTMSISVLKLLFNFPLAITFAIMLTEMPGRKFKRVVQTVSYLPHFISWVIVSGLLFTFLSSSSGMLTDLFKSMGIEMPAILVKGDYYYGLAVFSELWKEMGWNAIIYLAAISGIDPTLYESAQIDGAGRIRRIFNITLPSIRGTIAVLLILGVGGLMGGANFEQSLLLGNSTNIARSEIIEVYVYNQGLVAGRYSYAAAAGLFQSMISLFLVISANWFSRRFLDTSLF